MSFWHSKPFHWRHGAPRLLAAFCCCANLLCLYIQTCAFCLAGTFADTVARVNCSGCPQGKFQATPGQSACLVIILAHLVAYFGLRTAHVSLFACSVSFVVLVVPHLARAKPSARLAWLESSATLTGAKVALNAQADLSLPAREPLLARSNCACALGIFRTSLVCCDHQSCPFGRASNLPLQTACSSCSPVTLLCSALLHMFFSELIECFASGIIFCRACAGSMQSLWTRQVSRPIRGIILLVSPCRSPHHTLFELLGHNVYRLSKWHILE